MMNIKKFLRIAGLMILCIVVSGCNSEKRSSLPDIKYPHIHYASNSYITADGSYKYIVYKDSIYKAPISTNDFECIYQNENIVINKVGLIGDEIYFSTADNLYLLDRDGSREVIFSLTEKENIIWQGFRIYGEKVLLKKGRHTEYTLAKTETGYSYTDRTDGIRYMNSRGMEFSFDMRSERGDGVLVSAEGIAAAGSEEYILNEGSFILAGDNIVYITGEKGDFEQSFRLCRKEITGGEREVIAEYDTDIRIAGCDGNYVYYHDFNRYYRLDLRSWAVEKTMAIYADDGVYEICDGQLYKVLTLYPTVTDMDSGSVINLNLG